MALLPSRNRRHMDPIERARDTVSGAVFAALNGNHEGEKAVLRMEASDALLKELKDALAWADDNFKLDGVDAYTPVFRESVERWRRAVEAAEGGL